MADNDKLPEEVEKAVAGWENATRQTIGPLVDTPAFNALTECIAELRPALASVIADRPTST